MKILSLLFIVLITGCSSFGGGNDNNPYTEQRNVFQNIYFESIDGLIDEKEMNRFEGYGTAVLRITDGQRSQVLPWRLQARFHKNKLMTDAHIIYPINFNFMGENNFSLKIPLISPQEPISFDDSLRRFRQRTFGSNSNLSLTLNKDERQYRIILPNSVFDYSLNNNIVIGCNIQSRQFRLNSAECSSNSLGVNYQLNTGSLAYSFDGQFIYENIKRDGNVLSWGFNYTISGDLLDEVSSNRQSVINEVINDYLTYINHINDSRDRYELNINNQSFQWPAYHSFNQRTEYCSQRDLVLIDNPTVQSYLNDYKIYNRRCYDTSRENNINSEYFFVQENNRAGYFSIEEGRSVVRVVLYDYLSNNKPYKQHYTISGGSLKSFKATDFIDESKILE